MFAKANDIEQFLEIECSSGSKCAEVSYGVDYVTVGSGWKQYIFFLVKKCLK